MAVELFVSNFRCYERYDRIKKDISKDDSKEVKEVADKTEKIIINAFENIKTFFLASAFFCFSNYTYYKNAIPDVLFDKKNQLLNRAGPVSHPQHKTRRKTHLVKGHEVYVEGKKLHVPKGFNAYKLVAVKFTEEEYQKINQCLNRFVLPKNSSGIVVPYKSFMLNKTTPKDVVEILNRKIHPVSNSKSSDVGNVLWGKVLLSTAVALGIFAVSYGIFSFITPILSTTETLKTQPSDVSLPNVSAEVSKQGALVVVDDVNNGLFTCKANFSGNSMLSEDYAVSNITLLKDLYRGYQFTSEKIVTALDSVIGVFVPRNRGDLIVSERFAKNTGALTLVDNSWSEKLWFLNSCKNRAITKNEGAITFVPRNNDLQKQALIESALVSQTISDRVKTILGRALGFKLKNHGALILSETTSKVEEPLSLKLHVPPCYPNVSKNGFISKVNPNISVVVDDSVGTEGAPLTGGKLTGSWWDWFEEYIMKPTRKCVKDGQDDAVVYTGLFFK